jgi:ATP-binding cassette subfamily B (MDR/TAP) protein 1
LSLGPEEDFEHQASHVTQTEDDVVDNLVAKADKTIEQFEKDQEKEKETVPYSKILMTYADSTDKVLMCLGYIFSIASGIGTPSFAYLLGDIMVNFTDPNLDLIEGIKPIIFRFIGVGVGMFITAYFYSIFLAIMAERIGKKTRVAYFKAILSQEIAWFDSEIKITELSARLSKESQAI